MTTDLTKLTSSAQFENREFSVEEMKQIGQSTKLLGISFINCPITDEDVLQISNLPKLVNLTLENTKITDKSLEYLSKTPNLKYLFITNADLTGAGFKYFEHNKKIDCIWACSTKLNDENLKHLANIPKLDTLVINDTSVTFEGLMAIADNARLDVVAKDIFTPEQIKLFQSEQRKLKKKSLLVNDNDIEIAKTTLLSFFNAMTEWEKYANEVGFTEDLSDRCKEIFKKFCVDKPRAGYRPEGLYFSGAPNYTYGQETFVDSEQVSKNRIYFYTNDHIDFQYRYILIKKDNAWKIDERQWQSGGWKKRGL